jgi:hypothetical protein
MGVRRQYRRKAGSRVVAVRLALDFDGFEYRKWGGPQHAKQGDWLVDNGGNIYTVDADSFAETYRAVGGGLYEKVASVWAEVAEEPGEVATKEGKTRYERGDYIVSNDAQGADSYAVSAAAFEAMYEAIGD